MKLLMENWRKFLNEISVFEKDAAVNTILDKMGTSEFYPEVKNAEIFVNRQAAKLMTRVPMVWSMLRYMNQDQEVTQQDVMEILLQRALKGRTFEALTKSEQEYMKKYGLKYPDEPEEHPEVPTYSLENIPADLLGGATAVMDPNFHKKKLRENSIEERGIIVANALVSLVLNAAHAGIDPPQLYNLDDEDLETQIEIHNHNEEVTANELFNAIRGKKHVQ